MIACSDLKQMIQIRCVEEKLLELFSQGKVRGTTHTCIGQEATAVGVVGALDGTRDTVFSNHRGHGHFLTATKNLKGFLAELMGKEGAVCQGVGGSQHLRDAHYYGNGIQGGVPGVGAGIGMALKFEKKSGVSCVFLGDGTFGEGLTYESLNMASLWNLPVLFVVEDNDMAQSTPSFLNRLGCFETRFQSFGIDCFQMSGQKIWEIRKVALDTINKIRDSGKPHALIFKTHRLAPHSKGDDTRSLDEMKKLWEEDPIQLALNEYPDWKDELSKYQKEFQTELNDLVGQLENTALAPGFLRDLSFPKSNLKTGYKGKVSSRLNESLHQLMSQYSKTILLGEDIADDYGGTFNITKGISTQFPDRCFTSPISEAGIMAIGNGLSLRGFYPIVEIMFGDFLGLTMDQLLNHGSLFPFMYGKQIPFSMVIRTPMGGRRGYGPTHSKSIEKYFMGMKGMPIVAVNHLCDPAQLLSWSHQYAHGPVLFIENKLLYNEKFPKLIPQLTLNTYSENQGTRIIHLVPKSEADFVLLGYGGMAPLICKLAKKFYDQEVFCHGVIPELVSPIGAKLLETLLELQKPLLIVEESIVDFGWGAEVVAQLLERGFSTPIKRLGAKHDCIPSSIHLENKALPQEEDLIEAAMELIS